MDFTLKELLCASHSTITKVEQQNTPSKISISAVYSGNISHLGSAVSYLVQPAITFHSQSRCSTNAILVIEKLSNTTLGLRVPYFLLREFLPYYQDLLKRAQLMFSRNLYSSSKQPTNEPFPQLECDPETALLYELKSEDAKKIPKRPLLDRQESNSSAASHMSRKSMYEGNLINFYVKWSCTFLIYLISCSSLLSHSLPLLYCCNFGSFTTLFMLTL